MKFLRSFIILLFIFKVSNAQLSHYEIKGDVKNLPAKQIYLSTMKHHPVSNQPYVAKIDSAEIHNGKFILNKDTNILEPSWASSLIYLDTVARKQKSFAFFNPYTKGKHLGFILENALIKIEGDLTDSKGILISGSKETDFQLKYGEQLFLYTKTQAVDERIAELNKIKNEEKLALAIKEKADIILDFKSNLKKIFEENPSNYLSILFLKQHAKLFTAVELKDIYSSFANNYKNSDKGLKLNTYISQISNLEVGAVLPAFSYIDKNGKSYNLNDIKGKKGTLVIFWASWCGPCRDEIPDLKKLYQIYSPKQINFVSVSTDHDIAKWKQALSVENMPWVNLSNLPGNSKEINLKYNLDAIPSMFLIDGEGRIVMADENSISSLKEALAKL
jgi:thiol-disulfide isomerase/thioredoxin